MNILYHKMMLKLSDGVARRISKFLKRFGPAVWPAQKALKDFIAEKKPWIGACFT